MKFYKKNFKIIEFKKSKVKHKKYAVILQNKDTSKKYTMNFGDKRFQHYYDRIGLYSDLNHGDNNRRLLYRKRHKNTYDPKIYSPAYFSWKFLWN